MSYYVFSQRLGSKQLFISLVILSSLAYFIIQCAYIRFAMFSLDDFWLAYHTKQYETALPYRDFSPYKSVLGYYVFLLPIHFFHGVLTPLFYTKVWIALINTFFMVGTSLWLKKFFTSKAILVSFLLIVTTPSFLLFSSEIRVDVLAYWFCLVSVLCLFDKHYLLAGVMIALAFLVCQKAIWYYIATNGGLLCCWIFQERSWKMLRQIALFNAATLVILSVYILFWSAYSSFEIVLNSLFYEPYLIRAVNWYTGLRKNFWFWIITDNAEVVLLSPVALFGILMFPIKNKPFIFVYSLIVLVFIIECKQPFIYHPVAAFPVLFLLFSVFFSAIDRYCYEVTHANESSERLFNGVVALALLLTLSWPLMRFINLYGYYDGRFQRATVHLMSHLLKDGGTYIAGIPLLMDIEQPVPGLVHLVAPSIDNLYKPIKELKPALSLSSMYLSPATVPDMIESIKKAPIKLYVDNNRLHETPPQLHHYLATQYQHYWGSIYLYAPQIPLGQHEFNIKFSGHYQVKASSEVSIDDRTLQPNSIHYLSSQDHKSKAMKTYRLVLVPEGMTDLLDPRYQDNQWKSVVP